MDVKLDTNPDISRTYRPIWSDESTMQRVFMPLTIDGSCPIGCSYCYIPEVGKPVRPLTAKEVETDVAEVFTDSRFVPGVNGTLVSIGCDSEPMLAQNQATTERLVSAFQETGNPIQIASKLRLTKGLLELALNWPADNPPVVVNTSITTISLAANLEPGAPAPAERAMNFATLRDTRWVGAALLKPLSPATLRDEAKFVELFEAVPPDAVVIGKAYRRTRDLQARAITHPLAPEWVTQNFSLPEQEFIDRLQAAITAPVFLTSADVNRWTLGIIPANP